MSRKRWIVTGALIVAAAAIGWIAFKVNDAVAYARIATGYAAQQACSCLHVSGRTLASCMADYPADAIKGISFDTRGDHVRISALNGAFKAEAAFEEGYGCRIVN